MLKRSTFFFLVIASFFIFKSAFASTTVASQTVLGTSGVVIGSSFADGSGNEQFAISRINFASATTLTDIKLYQISRDSGATTTGQYPLLIFDSDHTTVLATSTNVLQASNLPTYSSGTAYNFDWTFSTFTASAGHTYYFGFQHIMPVISGYIYIQSKSTCGSGNSYTPASGYDNGQYQWRTTCGGSANTDYPTTLGGLKYDILNSTPPPSITPTQPTGTIANNPVPFFGTFFEPGPYLGSAFRLNLTYKGLNNDGIGGYTTNIDWSENYFYFNLGTYAHTETLSAGYYTYHLSLINTILGTTSTTTNDVSFSLASASVATSTSATSTIPISAPVATTTCSIWDTLGCIENALQFVFVPNMDAQRVNWQNFKTEISNKPPFGWFSLVQSAIGILVAGTTTKAFNTVDLSGLDPILFNQIKAILTLIFWVLFVSHLFRRLKHIQL